MNVRIMTKKRKKISVGVIMLAVILIFLQLETFSVKAEDETAAEETISAETKAVPKETTVDGSASNETAAAVASGSIKLGTPQNISISDDDWVLSFELVPEAQGSFDVTIERDGELVRSITYGRNPDLTVVNRSISEWVSESGTYSVVVKALDRYAPDGYVNSEPSAPVLKNYVKPETQLGTTVGTWDKETTGRFVFDSVKDAQRYVCQMYQVLSDGSLSKKGGKTFSAESGDKQSCDFSSMLERYGAGQYVVTVRALSGKLNEIANGVEGEASEVFDTTKLPVNVITDAINNSANTGEALAAITQNIPKDTLGLTMQTNDKALEQMKTLEERYIEEKGITVTKSVSKEASEYVEQDKVSMVGAGLNADAGNVSLDISVPDEPVKIQKQYPKFVQLNIKLVNNDTEVHELKVPVTITIPVPQGLEAKHLILLHYHGNGEPEKVVYKNNGNGTVSFTVKDFSVFVFAQNAAEDETVKPDEGETDTENKPTEPENEENGNETHTEEENEPEEEDVDDETADEPKSPKTSDTNPIGAYGALLMTSLTVIVIMANDKKKTKYTED